MKYASRKFIDLIQGAISKWANWDPPKKIAAGDYGMIINKTGEFEWEGNIYSSHFQEQLKSSKYKSNFDPTDAALRPQEQEGGDDQFVVRSWGVTAKEVKASAEAGVPGAVNAALKVDLQFDGNKRAAVLVMYKPRYSSLPNDERIIRLLKSMPDILKGKYIVTEVISCAAYMMHLSDKRSDPTTRYMPLYRLKMPRSKFWLWPVGHRGDEKNDDPIERWEDVEPPWDPLDEEGEEDEICDAEMHGNFGVFNDGYPDTVDMQLCLRFLDWKLGFSRYAHQSVEWNWQELQLHEVDKTYFLCTSSSELCDSEVPQFLSLLNWELKCGGTHRDNYWWVLALAVSQE
ncbi:hypothetical protein DFH29DRAFT_872489 [Suillus ampliporus]|nr:hypothetical protein DFH29DRAFT_872489 [Suillus ampliporus]